MAKQITQRIALEGGSEFRQGLKSLGDAGQQAFKQIQDAANGATSISTRLAPVIDSLQKKMKEIQTAAIRVRDSFNETTSSIRNTGRNVLAIGAAFTATTVAFGLAIKNVGEFTSNLETSATALNLTTQEFQNLTFAAKLSDVEADQFGRALVALNGKISEHQKQVRAQALAQRKLNDDFGKGKVGLTDYLDKQNDLNESVLNSDNVFQRLGISLEDTNGELLDGRQRLLAVADAFSKADGATQSLLLTELGFRRSKGMADFLKQGREGIIRLEEEARRIAPPLNDLQIMVGNRLDDAFDKAGKAAESASNALRLVFAPDLTRLVNAFTEAIVNNRTQLIEMASQIAASLRPIIDDIIRILRGEDVDPASLVGQVRSAVLALAADIRSAIGIIVSAWQTFVSILDAVAVVINGIFGTNITGQALAIAAVILTVTGAFGALASIIGLIISVIGLLAAAFGGINIALVAVAVAAGAIIGKELPDLVNGLANIITEVWQFVVDGIVEAWEGGVDFLVQKWNEFVAFIMAGVNAIKTAIASVGSFIGLSGGSSSGGQQGFAGGGMVRGPGTTTSDSILALLSNKEFVVKAKAVKYYGASFFNALNQMKLPRDSFNMGGLVGALTDGLIPGRRSFADGGLVGAGAGGPSGRPVILKIGDREFGPMIAGEDTVNKLQRYAAGQQVRSMGRKPSWNQS